VTPMPATLITGHVAFVMNEGVIHKDPAGG
jgi:hypothetical protein